MEQDNAVVVPPVVVPPVETEPTPKVSELMRVHGATLKSSTMRETFEEFAKFFEAMEKSAGNAIGEAKFGE